MPVKPRRTIRVWHPRTIEVPRAIQAVARLRDLGGESSRTAPRGWTGPRHGARTAPMPLLNTGDVAPDFTLPSHDGKTVKLSELKGKTVVIWFYPKADTPG
jgi:AhpC/TSA family